jgi:HEAT repeat protein
MGSEARGASSAIADAIADANVSVARNCVFALAKLNEPLNKAQAQNLLPVLVRLLKGGNFELRCCCLMVLGLAGPEASKAVPELMVALKDTISEIRGLAAETLGKIGSDAEEALPTLLEILNLDSEKNKAKAAQAIGRLGQKGKLVIAELQGAAGSSDENLQQAARAALLQLGKLTAEDFPYLSKALLDKNALIRAAAAKTFGEFRGDEKKAVPNLVAALDDPEKTVRQNALSSLKKIGFADKDVMDAVERTLLQDVQPGVRAQAAEALGTLGQSFPEQTLSCLGKALSDEVANVRVAAAKNLAGFGAKAKPVDSAIKKGLRDSDDLVKIYCARLVGAFGKQAKDTIPDLVNLLKSYKFEVRFEAVRALGTMGSDAVGTVPELIEILAEKKLSDDVVYSLISLGPGGQKDLYQGSRSRNPHVRICCIRVLSRLPLSRQENETLVGNLRFRLNAQVGSETDPKVRAEIVNAIKRIRFK